MLRELLPDYMLEEPYQPKIMPAGYCFYCGEELYENDGYEEEADLMFCNKHCLTEAFTCQECGQAVEEPKEVCEDCRWRQKIQRMGEIEFLDEFGTIIDIFELKSESDFCDPGQMEIWYTGAQEGLEALAKLFEAREIDYWKTAEAVIINLEYKFIAV